MLQHSRTGSRYSASNSATTKRMPVQLVLEQVQAPLHVTQQPLGRDTAGPRHLVQIPRRVVDVTGVPLAAGGGP